MAVRIYLEIGHEASLRTKKTQEGFTHDWEVFVRGCDGAEIHCYVEKVVFYLHETFPKPKRVVKEPPYSVKESGYAGFNLPIDIYLRNSSDPKKIRFNYDLHLQQTGPPILKVQKEKYVFSSVQEDFKMKLLKGGALVGGSSTTHDLSENRQSFDDKNQMISKPKLSGSDFMKKPKMKIGEPCRDFQELFGSPINMTTKVAEIKVQKQDNNKMEKPRMKFSPHKDKEKSSSSTSKEGGGEKRLKDNNCEKRSKEKSKDRSSKEKSSNVKKDKSPSPKRFSSPPPPPPLKYNKESSSSGKHEKRNEKKSKKRSKEDDHKEQNKKKEDHKDSSPNSNKKERSNKERPPKDDKYNRQKRRDKEKNREKKEEKSHNRVPEKKIEQTPKLPVFKNTETLSVKNEKSVFQPDDESSNNSVSSTNSSPKITGKKLKKEERIKVKKENSIKCKRKSDSIEKEQTPPEKISKHHLNNNSDDDDDDDEDDVKEVKQEEIEEDYFGVLRQLQHKIMGLKDNADLQKVVKLIAETGRYEVSAHTFDFDLCLLDRSTVQQLQKFFTHET